MKLLLKCKIRREPVVTGLFKLSLEQGRTVRERQISLPAQTVQTSWTCSWERDAPWGKPDPKTMACKCHGVKVSSLSSSEADLF